MIKLKCENCGVEYHKPADFKKWNDTRPNVFFKWSLSFCDSCRRNKEKEALKNLPEIIKELKYGFKYGDATIERHISDEKKGWVVLGLETTKQKLQIYVTNTGKVRIHDKDGKEWLPSNGG